jgi:cytosine/adenosine deaminase-related metal-dependent hydrolase
MCGNGETLIEEGPLDGKADHAGVILPKLIDTHTHCADAGVKVGPGMTLEELVAPPNGLKHRYLKETPRETIMEGMKKFGRTAERNGIGTFIDFREGGLDGVLMAKQACGSAVILGRPLSGVYDSSEVDSILSVADGIALSSISDIDLGYAEKVADAAHKAHKAFAIHCSERVREDIDAVLSLSPDFIVHMCEATDSDLRKCADAGIPISVCPRSNIFFGKNPPLLRMKNAGCTVAMGTDNAMLCTPDLRPEAGLFYDLLNRDASLKNWVWECLSAGGQQLLYRTRKISARKEEMGFAVLPMPGTDPESAWSCTDPVISFRNGGIPE